MGSVALVLIFLINNNVYIFREGRVGHGVTTPYIFSTTTPSSFLKEHLGHAWTIYPLFDDDRGLALIFPLPDDHKDTLNKKGLPSLWLSFAFFDVDKGGGFQFHALVIEITCCCLFGARFDFRLFWLK